MLSVHNCCFAISCSRALKEESLEHQVVPRIFGSLIQNRSILKMLGKKVEMLATSIFSFFFIMFSVFSILDHLTHNTNCNPFPEQALLFTCLHYIEPYENTIEKGKIARFKNFLIFSSKLEISSANTFIQKSLKFVILEQVKAPLEKKHFEKPDKVKKHGKRRKWLVLLFSPFPSMFSTPSKERLMG